MDAGKAEKWLKQEFVLEAKATDHNARLELTSGDKGVFWLDQISAMPTDTFKVGLSHAISYLQVIKLRCLQSAFCISVVTLYDRIDNLAVQGHGFRKELALMLEDLKPGFLRFPGTYFATYALIGMSLGQHPVIYLE